ncbi:hypothetical protein ABJB81_006266 [Pseudomonas putida]
MPVEKTALDSIDLDALHVAAKAAAEDVIRSHGWKGMVEDADLLGTDERYLVLADPAVVSGLIEEIKTLRGNYDAAVTRIKELDLLFGRYLLGMRAAVIEWQNGRGAEAGMEWIWNGLAGPGELPPENEAQAQAYFDREVVPIEAGLEEVYALLEQRRAAKQVNQ